VAEEAKNVNETA
jgi:hypothetical protein